MNNDLVWLQSMRFQITVGNLGDCIRHLWDEDLSADEERARNDLILACLAVAQQFDETDDEIICSDDDLMAGLVPE